MIAVVTNHHPATTLKRNSARMKSPKAEKKTIRAKFENPKKRRVRFGSESADVSAARNTTPEELRSRWYSIAELTTFKQDSTRMAAYTITEFGSNALPRGMEGYTEERLKHKMSTMRCVVMAHKMGKDTEFVADLYRKCSGWNKDLAFNQACRDYVEVYSPAMLSQVQPVLTKAPKIALIRRSSKESSVSASIPTPPAFSRRSAEIAEVRNIT